MWVLVGVGVRVWVGVGGWCRCRCGWVHVGVDVCVCTWGGCAGVEGWGCGCVGVFLYVGAYGRVGVNVQA